MDNKNKGIIKINGEMVGSITDFFLKTSSQNESNQKNWKDRIEVHFDFCTLVRTKTELTFQLCQCRIEVARCSAYVGAVGASHNLDRNIVFTDKGELVLTAIENEERDTETILSLKTGKELTIHEVTKYLNVSPETLMKAIIGTPTIYDDKKH